MRYFIHLLAACSCLASFATAQVTVATSDIEAVTKATPRFQKQAIAYTGSSASPQIRIFTLGDSFELSNETNLASVYGWGGRIVSPNRLTVGNPADYSAMYQLNSYTSSPMGSYMLVADGQTLVAGRNGDSGTDGNGAAVLGNHLRVIYMTDPAAGTLEVETQTNATGSWTSRGTINAAAAAGWAEYSNSTLTSDYYRVRVRGTTAGKSVRVVAMGVHEKDTTGIGNNRRPGVVRFHCGGDGTTPPQWNTPGQGYWNACMGIFKPHLVFIRGLDTLTDWQNNLPSIVTKIRTASPDSEIVLLGEHPTNGQNNPGSDDYLRTFAESNNCAFIDIKRYLPSYAMMNAAGMMADGVHMNAFGNRLASSIITAHFPILESGILMEGNRDFLSNAGKPLIDASVSGLIDAGTVSLADSKNDDVWITARNLEGNSTNYPTRGSIGFLKAGNANHRLDHSTVIAAGPVNSALALFKDDTWAGVKLGRDMISAPPSTDGGWLEVMPFVTNTPAQTVYVPSGQTANAFEVRKNATKSSAGSLTAGYSKLGVPFGVLDTYPNDAAADADANLPKGGFYRLTGSRAVYCKP